jgi:hypothetical protein
MTLFGAGNDVAIGDTVSFHFTAGSYDLGAAGAVYLNLGGTENEVTLFGDQHDVTLDGFAPSAGSILHLPETLFADFDEMRAHATQQGNNVVLDTGDHLVTFLNLHLEDLGQASFSFG